MNRATGLVVLLAVLTGCAADDVARCLDGSCLPGTSGAGGGVGAVDAGFADRVRRFNDISVSTTYKPAPIMGGTLALSGPLAVASDADRERVWVADYVQGVVKGYVQFPDGSRPNRAVVDAQNHAHVVLRGSEQIAHIDLNAISPADDQAGLLGVDRVCTEPRGITIDPKSQELLVSCQGGDVVRYRPGSPPTQVLSRGSDLRDVMLDADGGVWVSTFRSAELHGPNQDRWTALSFDEFQSQVAWRTVATPEGFVMLHQRESRGTISLGDQGSQSPYGGGASGEGLCLGGVVTSALTFFDHGIPRTIGLRDLLAVDVDVAPEPDGVGVRAIVAGAGSLGATLYEHAGAVPMPLTPCVLGSFVAGGQFTGARFGLGGLAVLHERREAKLVIKGERVQPTEIRLALDTVESPGNRFFHSPSTFNSSSDAPTGLTCASCHPEGGEDGHVWLLDGQQRRTQSLAGGVSARAPFHWEGSLPSLTALLGDTFVRRMGGGLPPPEVVSDLATWLDTIPATRSGLPSTPAQLAAGRAAFEKADCQTCHSGPQLTNNARVNVGTSGVFKTPSLVGLNARGPWMHDGCAPSLRARFDGSTCGGTAHGDASRLSPDEFQLLLIYLSSL